MDVKVKVPSDRKCFGSIDWDEDAGEDGEWTLSFGDKETPETDVEIKFTHSQMLELKGLLSTVGEKPPESIHRGCC